MMLKYYQHNHENKNDNLLLITCSLLLIHLWTAPQVNAEVELCTDGGQHVFQISHEMCPFGVLFTEPQTADCVVFTGEDASAVAADVCEKEMFSTEKRQFQYIPEISPDPIENGTSCKYIKSSMCNLPTERVHASSFRHRVPVNAFLIGNEGNESNIAAVKEQTHRMFQLMIGLSDIDMDESLRVVSLLKKTFEIFKKFCDHDYVRQEFYEDVEQAFIFLINEADATKIRDISVEEFDRIMQHLIDCSDQKNPFKFQGKRCVTYSMINKVNKSGQVFSEFDTSHHDAFDKYDVPSEAAWGAIDFVHGLCYGTFRDHINSHHLYQQALERLFTKEIQFRWKNRYVLTEQQVWNNFFSANVKNALVNMDLCIQSAYLSTPFLHRLERPVDNDGSSGATKGRRKRWAEVHGLRNLDDVEGYCFQTKDEADDILNTFCG